MPGRSGVDGTLPPEALERLPFGDAQRELGAERVFVDARELPQRLVEVLGTHPSALAIERGTGILFIDNMLLDYLVPSRARRSLLKAIRARGGGTVLDLSRHARVPYSAAHRELELMAQAGVVRRNRTAGGWACSWAAGRSGTRLLDGLLAASGSAADGPPERIVIAQLKRWGAPLVEAARSRELLSLEETLVYAIRVSRLRPEVLRVWPLVLARHESSVNLRRLRILAGRVGEKKALGFLLALTARLLRRPGWAAEAERLRDGRTRKMENYFLEMEGPRAARLTVLRTPALARRWLFRMNMPMETFESHFRKFWRPA